MGSSLLEPSGTDVIRDRVEGALGLPGRESKWNWARRKQDGSSLGSRDTSQTQARASVSAPGNSVWGSGVLAFCRLQVGADGKTVVVVITAPGHWLLYMLHRSPNFTQTRKVRSPPSPDPQPTQAGGPITGGPITGGPWASVGLVWRRSRTCLDLNPDSITDSM